MNDPKQNYYGKLCVEMYEILHEEAPQGELNFYLSYAEKGNKQRNCIAVRRKRHFK